MTSAFRPLLAQKGEKKNPKDPWRKSFKGKLPQSFDLFLEHFQPKNRCGNKKRWLYDRKKTKIPKRGRIMTGNISNGNEPAGTSGSAAILYGQNANIIS